MKFGFDNKLRERLISLGELLADIRVQSALPEAYTKSWLDGVIGKFALGIL